VRAVTLPPGTPKERVQLLRKAFQATLHDAAFLAEAEKAKLEIEPLGGEELEKVVERLFQLEPPMVARLKGVLLD
jgi:tripartite-type tricarboxylate transporter receptor subunit TctC